jgi:predicted PurR-regulated permease PerM
MSTMPPEGTPAEEGAPRGAPSRRAAEGREQEQRILVPRWLQLVLAPLAVIALWLLARAAGKTVELFIVASIIALVLNPLVGLLARGGLRRGLAVLAVYLGFFILVAALGYLLAHPIAHQAERFAHAVPHIIKEANHEIARLQSALAGIGVHVHFVTQGKTALQTLGAKVVKSSSVIAEFGAEFLKEAAGAIFDVVVVFVLSVYMLLYGERIGALVRSVMPGGEQELAAARRRERIAGDDYPTLIQRAVARYVGGQLLFSALLGTTTGLGLYIFGLLGIFPDGERFALAFGVFYALMELVPYIGPFLGAAPPVLVALFTEPLSALWVALFFVAMQELEGHVVAPQIFGRTLRLNPLLVIFALLAGLDVGGLIGALVALPLLSIVRETVLYFERHLTFERWPRSPQSLL